MDIDCKEARKDIDYFFSGNKGGFKELEWAKRRFLSHIFDHEEEIQCLGCYKYYLEKKKEYDNSD